MYAVPFAGIIILAYLKDREFVYTLMSIDKFFRVSEFRSLLLAKLQWRKWIFSLYYFLLHLLCLKLFQSLAIFRRTGQVCTCKVFLTSTCKLSYEEKLKKVETIVGKQPTDSQCDSLSKGTFHNTGTMD